MQELDRPLPVDRVRSVEELNFVAYIDRNGNGDLTDPEDRVLYDAEASEKLTFSNASAFSSGDQRIAPTVPTHAHHLHHLF